MAWLHHARSGASDEMEQVRSLRNPEVHIAISFGGDAGFAMPGGVVIWKVGSQQIALLEPAPGTEPALTRMREILAAKGPYKLIKEVDALIVAEVQVELKPSRLAATASAAVRSGGV